MPLMINNHAKQVDNVNAANVGENMRINPEIIPMEPTASIHLQLVNPAALAAKEPTNLTTLEARTQIAKMYGSVTVNIIILPFAKTQQPSSVDIIPSANIHPLWAVLSKEK